MGCDDYLLGGRYLLGATVAVGWNDELAQRFPDAGHRGCRQEHWHDGNQWQPYTPARCRDWHCPRCGTATGSNGHDDCTN